MLKEFIVASLMEQMQKSRSEKPWSLIAPEFEQFANTIMGPEQMPEVMQMIEDRLRNADYDVQSYVAGFRKISFCITPALQKL